VTLRACSARGFYTPHADGLLSVEVSRTPKTPDHSEALDGSSRARVSRGNRLPDLWRGLAHHGECRCQTEQLSSPHFRLPRSARPAIARRPGRTTHPPPALFPSLRWRPDLLRGIPVAREILCFCRVIPVTRFQENPPRFAIAPPRIARQEIPGYRRPEDDATELAVPVDAGTEGSVE
jgi:hypothetical protein